MIEKLPVAALLLIAPWQVRQVPPPGSIVGRVLTYERGPIVGATVTLIGIDQRRTAPTDSQGRFEAFESLPPGTYRLEVDKVGFLKQARDESDESIVLVRGDRVSVTRLVRVAPEVPNSVEGRIAAFVGVQAVTECGEHSGRRSAEAALLKSLDCAVRTSETRAAFRTTVQFDGGNAWRAQGLMATIDGTIFQFSYDSRVPTFTYARCPRPTVAIAPPDLVAPWLSTTDFIAPGPPKQFRFACARD